MVRGWKRCGCILGGNWHILFIRNSSRDKGKKTKESCVQGHIGSLICAIRKIPGWTNSWLEGRALILCCQGNALPTDFVSRMQELLPGSCSHGLWLSAPPYSVDQAFTRLSERAGDRTPTPRTAYHRPASPFCLPHLRFQKASLAFPTDPSSFLATLIPEDHVHALIYCWGGYELVVTFWRQLGSMFQNLNRGTSFELRT